MSKIVAAQPPPRFATDRPLVHYAASTQLGGAELYLRTLTWALARRGIPQALICSHRPLFDDYARSIAERGIRVVRIPMRSSVDYRPFYTVLPLIDDRQVRLDRAVLSALQPGLLHINQRRRSDGQPALLAAGVWGDYPVVSTLHFHYPFTRATRWIGAFHGLATRLLVRILHEDRVVMVSHIGAQNAPANFGVDPARVRIIHGSVDADRFQARTWPRPARAGRGARILITGRLDDRIKGQSVAIRAMPIILATDPDAQLRIAGTGPDRDMLESLVCSLGLQSSVHFLGWVDDIAQLLDEADVLLVPSRLDGFPLTILEGFGMGAAVVASHVGGIPEAVIHEETGLLVAPGSPEALGGAVAKLLTDTGLRERIVERAHAVFLERYTGERMADEALAVYTEVLAERNREG